MVISRGSFLGAIAFLLLLSAADTAFGCTADGEGGHYDLSPLTINEGADYNVPDPYTQTSFYLINICRKLLTVNSFCEDGTGVCQSTSGGGAALGQVSKAGYTIEVLGDGSLLYTYDKNELYSTTATIQFTCGSDVGSPVFKDININNGVEYYRFNWSSKHACSGSAKLSGGSIFLIIFFVCVFLYLIIGMIYSRQKHGATGVDMVPNLDFWKELPVLVKDGCKYTYNKISGN